MTIKGGEGIPAIKGRRTDRGQSGRWARPLAEVLESRQLLSTITVNSAGDADGADGSKTLSLRQAIEIANGTLPVASLTPTQQSLVVGSPSTPETINFDIPGAGPFTITPATALPAITVPVVINGYSQPGSSPNTGGPGQADNAVIQVGLSGAALPVATSADTVIPGLVLAGGASTVQGLAVFNFSGTFTALVDIPIGGGHGNFIFVTYSAAAIRLKSLGGNLIHGNFIGLDTSGNPGTASNSFGIDDQITSDVGDTIGGTAASDRNVISDDVTGVSVPGTSLVQGNFIGTDPTGTRAILTNARQDSSTGISTANSTTIGGTAAGAGNIISGYGTGISGGAIIQGNLIGTDITGTRPLGNIVGVLGAKAVGGTGVGEGNVISGNTIGVEFTGLIEGNLIGTDITGTRPLGNGTGVFVNTPFFSGDTTIGGTATGARNVISSNANYGIYVIDYPGEANLIQGNFVGTDVTGTHALSNDVGIDIISGNNNTIGGTAAGAGNVISGNGSTGIRIDFGNSGNLVHGNLIGVDASGNAPLPNAGDGVLVNGSFNLIGGTSVGAANVIAYNGQAGVDLKTSDDVFGNTITAPNRVTISGNAIYGNTGLGIDLGGDGVTPNNPAGSPTGPNLLQPYPVLTSATPTPTGAAITGVLDALPLTPYVLEFFSNPTADPSGYGQGQTYIGTTVATTDASGHASFSFATTADLGGQFLSATATDPMGNTSEFAKDLQAYSTTTRLTTRQPIPSVVGQPLTLLAAVTAANGAGTPIGQVDFTEDGRPIGSATLDATGAASLTIPASAGSHTFAASYAGSPGNPGSLSAGLVVTVVGQGPSTTTLVGPTSPVAAGQLVNFDAIVASGAGVIPTGLVAFAEDGVVIGSALLDASGVAVLTTNTLTTGTHVISAVFSGDESNLASLSNYVAVTVASPATTTTLIGPTAASVFGRPVTFAAVVAPSTPGGPISGMVAFAENGIILGEAPVDSSGVAVFITNSLPLGANVVAAVYLGDPSNAISLSNYVSAAVLPTSALTSLVGPTGASTAGRPVTFAAIVSPTVGDAVPTGMVVFAEGGVVLGEAPLNASGVTVFITDRLPIGTNAVAAVYLGDASNAPSLSNYVSVRVRPTSAPALALKASSVDAVPLTARRKLNPRLS